MTEAIPSAAEPVPSTQPTPPLRPLTRRERQFVAEYLIDFNGAEAVRRCAWYKGKLVRQKAHRLLKRPPVRAAIEKALAENLQRAADKAEQMKRLVEATATANPNELQEFRRESCRYCWGIDNKEQFTPAEQAGRRAAYDRTLKETQAKNPNAPIEPFDELGGVGFNPHRSPNPQCQECFGDGRERVFIHDTRNLSPEARALYAGIKQTEKGIEIKVNSQDRARELFCRLSGLVKEKHEHTGKDGAPLAPPIINIGFENGGPGEPVARPKGP